MTRKKLSVLSEDFEDDFLVDVTLRNIPSSLLREFLEKIVSPYYNGSLNKAAKDLMQKAVTEQNLVLAHTRKG
jgi:hypothetical protein